MTRQSGSIDGLIRYGAKVVENDVGNDGVSVVYEEDGAQRTRRTDYCICTILMPIFKGMKTNLPAEVMKTAANLPVMDAGKVDWRAERFWEINDQIYGGISRTDDLIDWIWYPSSGFLSKKGTLTGAYMRGGAAVKFNAKSLDARLQMAREAGKKLHPGFSKRVEHGIAIGWGKWSSPGTAGPTRAMSATARTPQCPPSRRAASSLPATRRPSCRSGRKTRRSERGRRSNTSTARLIRGAGVADSGQGRREGWTEKGPDPSMPDHFLEAIYPRGALGTTRTTAATKEPPS